MRASLLICRPRKHAAHPESLQTRTCAWLTQSECFRRLFLVDAERVTLAVSVRFQLLTGLFLSHWGPQVEEMSCLPTALVPDQI